MWTRVSPFPCLHLYSTNSTIKRFVVNSNLPQPRDAKRLRISGWAFRYLVSHYQVPPSFVTSVARFYQPAGKSFQIRTLSEKVFCYWYHLPVRVQVHCTETQRGHASSTAGSNQMDPVHYLHLPDMGLDIRGSQISLFFRHDIDVNMTTAICVNYQDGRWSALVQEPENRLQECFEHPTNFRSMKNPLFIHLVYLTSVTRWWDNVLSSFNDQLIAHVRQHPS